jgi:hypothetical protein
LAALRVGNFNVLHNQTDALPAAHCFRGNLVLDVYESTEPSAIRWQDLDETFLTKVKERLLSGALTLAVMLFGFWLVAGAYLDGDVSTAALEITLLNILMPHVFKRINALESHQYEDSYQASLYWKLTIFRWVNTGLVPILIKPFSETLADTKGSLIASVHAVLRAEIMIAPVVHLLDIGGFVKRIILAPRAPDQASMNAFFHGSQQNLGEKFTSATKIIFVVFFYGAIFPSGFFYGALALFLTYLTDKYLMLRSWGPMPQVRNAVARLSRKVFFPMTVVILAITSDFFYSAYPCDNLCDTDRIVGADEAASYLGTHTVTSRRETPATIPSATVSKGDVVYEFCNQQGRLSALLNLFSIDRETWMSEDQESMAFVFGLFAVGMVVLMVLVNLPEDLESARSQVLGGFVSNTDIHARVVDQTRNSQWTYSCSFALLRQATQERDSGESFTKQEKITAYIPQFLHKNFAFPLIAADLSTFGRQHLGWEDPVVDHSYYNLQEDVVALDAAAAASKAILSRVYQYDTKLD